MTLRADDGTLLETKEGAILDREGNTLFDQRSERSEHRGTCYQYTNRSSGSTKVFKISPWLFPLVAVGFVAALTLGTVVLGSVLVLFFVLWVFRSVLRALF